MCFKSFDIIDTTLDAELNFHDVIDSINMKKKEHGCYRIFSHTDHIQPKIGKPLLFTATS